MPYFHHFLADTNLSDRNLSGSKMGVLKQVKAGYLLHFKKKLFGKVWRQEYVILYDDSSLIWFRAPGEKYNGSVSGGGGGIANGLLHQDSSPPEGAIVLRDCPEMIAAGQWIGRVPNRPEFPAGINPKLSIAIGTRSHNKVHWFLCSSESDLVDWMSAISYTLPPPPRPPDELRLKYPGVFLPPVQPISTQPQRQLYSQLLAHQQNQTTTYLDLANTSYTSSSTAEGNYCRVEAKNCLQQSGNNQRQISTSSVSTLLSPSSSILSSSTSASRKKRAENGRLPHHGSSPEIKRKSVLSSAVNGGDDDFGKWNHNQTGGSSRTSGESSTWENEKVTSQQSSSRSNPKHKSHLNASTRSLSSSTVGNQKSTQQKTHAGGNNKTNHVWFCVEDEGGDPRGVSDTDRRLGKSLSDVTAGIATAGALTQWSMGAAAAASVTPLPSVPTHSGTNGYTLPSAAVANGAVPGDVGGSIDCGEGHQSEWGANSGGGGSAAAAEASSGSGDYWDWGMGWGWSGNSASYCQSCALEHAVVMSNQQQSSVNTASALPPEMSSGSNWEEYLNNLNGDHDDGEGGGAGGDAGGEADMGGDMGGDMGAF